MLIFASLIPYSPLLAPNVGDEEKEKIKKTTNALKNLSQDFYSTNPNNLIAISNHKNNLANSFTLNTAPQLKADFKQLGDLENSFTVKNDIGLSYKIKESVETKMPLQLVSYENLDYTLSIPLNQLIKTSDNHNIKVTPLNQCGLDFKQHFNFGKSISDFIHTSNKRIAIMASGNLSHNLTQDAPDKYEPGNLKNDKHIVDLIKNKKIEQLINLDETKLTEPVRNTLKNICILLGILDDINYTPQILSYEYPLGVSYVVCEFELNR